MSLIQAARDFAIRVHGEQRYGDHPYVWHLDAVAAIVEPYGETAQVIAYLHDTVEDTSATLNDVHDSFGALVAGCVELLTDERGETRKIRKAKTYAKLATVGQDFELALIVKTADRLANVRACVEDGKDSLRSMYASEQPQFKASAHRAGLCEPLWVELDQLFDLNDGGSHRTV